MTGLGPGKPLALLAYLAVRGEARREELVDLLWGAVPEANARNAFRQALHRLRSALGDELVPPDRDRVLLNQAASLNVDRDALVAALDRNDIAAAVDLYRGDFLEGFEVGEPLFDSWADAERLRLRSRFQSALHRGAEASLGKGRWLEALQLVQRLAAIAPYDEAAALLEANVLVAAGRSHEAVTALRRFTRGLREQLDLPPSAKVSELLSRIERTDSRPAEPTRRATPTIPFVGRESEVGLLMGAVRALSEERGATVVVEGPPGIGKSRLADEVLARARSTGPVLVLRGRERPFSASLPYASIAEALRGILKAPGISGTGRHLLAEAARILPELRDNFELPAVVPVEDEGGRLRFFEGVAALLDAAAYEQPICMVFDDMHNSSAASLELLAYLSARLQTSPLFILVLYRRDAAPPAIAERLTALNSGPTTAGDSSSGSLRLRPLERDVVVQLVSGMISRVGVEDQIDIDRIVGAAGGNPMRAIELARRGLDGDLPGSVPARLRDVLWARFQKASPSQRRVFFAASLLHRRASLRLLAAAAHLPELATQDAAAALAAAGLLSEEGDGFVVAHDVSLAFVSDSSGLAGRALLAGWAADALASEPGATGAELAHLYAMAGQPALAFSNARRGAFDAAAVGAQTEVHRLLELSLTYAADTAARAEIAAMLAAFGAGRPLLAAPGSVSAAAAERPVSSAPMPEPPAPSSIPPSQSPVAPRPRSFVTPRLYWLTAVLVAATALLVWRRSTASRLGQTSLADSLLVVERGAGAGSSLSSVTGPLDGASVHLASADPAPQVWYDALKRPWTHPVPSPNGRWVAVERMTDSGTDVYLLKRDTSDRIPVAVGGGDDVTMDWSPDGSALLVKRGRTLPDGSFDADLWSFLINDGHVLGAPVDTSASRAIREARWSPDGTRIAWVAQTGAERHQQVFVSRADGSRLRALTDDGSDNYNIAWSSDGGLLAFTSDRNGNPDLFAVEFEGSSTRLWTLASSKYPEDHAVFSPDDRYVAFQSTRDSDAAVYVMPALGGRVTRVTPAGRQYSIGGWRGPARATYIDRLRILGPSTGSVGDSIDISLLGVDRSGAPRAPDTVAVTTLDPGIAELISTETDSGQPPRFALKPRKPGVVRLVAAIPGWRYDTLTIRIGSTTATALIDDFRAGIDPLRWLPLGSPASMVKARVDGSRMLLLNGDLQYQSGLLSRDAFTIRRGLDAVATLGAPFAERALPAALLEVALVADARDESFDALAPQFNEIASVVWDGEASRFLYSVGAESKSDPISSVGQGATHVVRISVAANGDVSFFVDANLRWTSSLRFLGGSGDQRVRFWMGGRATGNWGSVSNVRVTPR